MTQKQEITEQQEAEQQAYQDAMHAQAEYEAQCQAQAEYEYQQARDEQSYYESCQ